MTLSRAGSSPIRTQDTAAPKKVTVTGVPRNVPADLKGMVDLMKSMPPKKAAEQLREFAEGIAMLGGRDDAAGKVKAAATQVEKTGKLPFEALTTMMGQLGAMGDALTASIMG